MNVYDFDETIYDGDSTVDFVKYSFIHRPKCLICLPKIVFIGLLFVLLVISFIMYSLSFVRFKTNFEKFIEQDRGFKNLPIISRLKQQGIFDEWEAQELIYRQVLRN